MTSEIKVDTISEKTAANGVTIDGLQIKDGGIQGASGTPLQIVTYQNNITAANTISSSTMTAIEQSSGNRLELKITPKSATSKIILYSAVTTYHEYAGHNAFIEALRDISGGTSDQRVQQYALRDEDTPNNYNLMVALPYNFVDTPNTTSEVTYHFKARVTDTSSEFSWVAANSDANYMQGQMFTLMEIGV